MGRVPVSPRLGLGLGHLSLETSSFFKFPLCMDSSLACAPAHGWLFWLLPSFLTTTLKSPSWLLLLFPSLLSGSQGFSEDIFTSYYTTLWGPHSFPQLPSSMCASLESLSTGQTAPLCSGTLHKIFQAPPLRNESTPHSAPCLIEEIHHPPTSQRSGHCPCCLHVPTPWSQSIKLCHVCLPNISQIHLLLFVPVQLPCFESPSAPAWIIAKTTSEPSLGSSLTSPSVLTLQPGQI